MDRSTTHGLLLLLGALLLFTAGPALAGAHPPPKSSTVAAVALSEVARRSMPPVDNGVLLAEAELLEAGGRAAPLLVAHAFPVDLDLLRAGTREVLDDGSRLWRLRIVSPGARHLNLGFSRFDLPPGAGLWIYNPTADEVAGPYAARHRSRRGRLYTPVVPGDEIVLELHVPAGAAGPLDVRLGSVQHGFRGFETRPAEKRHGRCNNDVVCPEGDPWRDQIRAVARYTIAGIFLCTGQLVNNTAEDEIPYFLSAFHCGVDPTVDDTLVFYWKYESPVCGEQDGGSLRYNQTGSIFRAGEAVNDFLLLELSEPPDPEFDVYYAGWDASGEPPVGSVSIHHPRGEVKSISFNEDVLTVVGWDPVRELVLLPGEGDDTHWLVDDWEDGTTEGGSSGACLFDPATRLCVGVLTAGEASCSRLDYDVYGQLATAWNGVPGERLRDWLDPLDTGVRRFEGRNPSGGGGGGPSGGPSGEPGGGGDPCSDDTVLCLQGDRFQVTVTRAGVDGPGPARVVPVLNDTSGLFWFFEADNWEMLVKVLDGCGANGHFWVFAASATDVEWTATVTDTFTGSVKSYLHAAGTPSPAITDVRAFPTCP